MTPVRYDFTWVRGTTTPIIFRFRKNGVAVPFDDVRLSVFNNNGRTEAFRLSVADGGGAITDPDTGEVTFTPTAEQTRMLTPTRIEGSPARNRYEVELRDGATENVYVLGDILGLGGLNDDETP